MQYITRLSALLSTTTFFVLSLASAQQSLIVNYSATTGTLPGGSYITPEGGTIFNYADDYGVHVISLDANYSTQWITNIAPTSVYPRPGKIIPLQDGGYLTYFGTSILHGHLVKLSAAGEIEWTKKMTDATEISQLLELPSGKIAVALVHNGKAAVLVIKPDGSTFWMKESGHVINGGQALIDLDMTPDGYFLLSYAAEEHQYHVLFSALGTVLWEKTYLIGSSGMYNVHVAPNGDFYSVGTMSTDISLNDAVVRRFSADGNFIAARSYGYDNNDSGYDIEQHSNGNLLIIGGSRPTGGPCGENMFVMGIEPDLDTIYTKYYGTFAASGINMMELQERNDVFYMNGAGTLWSTSFPSDGHLMRTDFFVNFDCQSYNQPTNNVHPVESETVNLTQYWQAQTMPVSNVSYSLEDPTLALNTFCLGPNLGAPENEIKVGLYPNPATNSFVVELDFTSADLTFELTNILGQTVEIQSIVSPTTEIQRNALPDGTYIYRVKRGDLVISSGKLVLN